MIVIDENCIEVKAVSIGLAFLTGFTYWLWNHHYRKMMNVRGKMLDLDLVQMPDVKTLDKVFIKGTIMEKKAGFRFVIMKVVNIDLDSRLNEMKRMVIIDKSNFKVGKTCPISIELDKLKSFESKVLQSSISPHPDFSDLRLLKFLNILPSFTKSFKSGIIHSTPVVIKGVAFKSKAGATTIKAQKLFLTTSSYLEKYQTRVDYSSRTFFILFSIFLAFKSVIYSLSYTPIQSNQSPVCRTCPKPACIIILPCSHLTYCRSCFLINSFCPICQNVARSYYQIKF